MNQEDIIEHKLITTILSCLMFDEDFNHIVNECKSIASENIIADVLKECIRKRLVSTSFIDEPKFKAGLFFDSDNMYHYRYQITAKGIDFIQE